MQASTREPRFSPRDQIPLSLQRNCYKIVCSQCLQQFADNGIQLACPNGCASLLRSEYFSQNFSPHPSKSNLARYADWLPGQASQLTAALPSIQRLPWLCTLTGLPKLSVALSGRWPKYAAPSATGSFKDLEACTVLARLSLCPQATVVLASAGNTALAFAAEATQQNRACVIVVTAETRARLRLRLPLGEGVHVVVVDGDAGYDDAITLSQSLADGASLVLEGGIRNIARRDGVGVVLLAAIEHFGELPAVYVQAVGSAAGAVAIHEMATRALRAGIGCKRPRLVLSQNAPFTPLVRSWNAQSPVLLAEDDEIARHQIRHISATVLSNLKPPYSATGGLYDVLRESQGIMLSVRNATAQAMRERFWQEEQILIDPAAAIAAASLYDLPQEIRNVDGPILLHLTGGAPLESTSSFTPPHEYHIAHAKVKDPETIARLRDKIHSVG